MAADELRQVICTLTLRQSVTAQSHALMSRTPLNLHIAADMHRIATADTVTTQSGQTDGRTEGHQTVT